MNCCETNEKTSCQLRSVFDGNLYARSAPSLTKHLKDHGYDKRQYFLNFIYEEAIHGPILCEYCNTSIRSYDKSKWMLKMTCGNRFCVGKMLKMRPEHIQHMKMLYTHIDSDAAAKCARNAKLANEQKDENGLTGYDRAKVKRQATCELRYGDKFYNNSSQISSTKKSMSEEDKKDIRLKLENTMLSRYGISHVWSKKSPFVTPWRDDKLSPAYLDWHHSLTESVFRRYSDENYVHRIVEKTKATNLCRFGIDWPLRLYNTRSSSSMSAISNEFLILLLANLPHLEAEREFHIEDQLQYRYDFRIGNSLIEFNGSFWHADPLRFSPTDVVKFPDGDHLAEDLWQRDLDKARFALSHGYRIYYVWEDSFKSNRNNEVAKVIKWLSEL